MRKTKSYLLLMVMLFPLVSGCSGEKETIHWGNRKELNLEESIIFTFLFGIRSQNLVFEDGRAYFAIGIPANLGQSGIYYLNPNLEVKCQVSINEGKGPDEVVSFSHFLYQNSHYYLYDQRMVRFIVYDDDFNYVETYNLNQNVSIHTFVKIGNDQCAVGCNADEVIFYKITFEKDAQLEEIYKFPINDKVHTSYDRYCRTLLTILMETDGLLVISAYDVVLFFEKIPELKKIGEVKLKVKRFKDGTSTPPSFVKVTNNGSFIYDNYGDRYYYDFKKRKMKKVEHDNVISEFELYGKQYRMLLEDKKYYIESEVE